MKFDDLFGGGGKAYSLLASRNFVQSGSFTAPKDGILVVRAMGAGGGGAGHVASTVGRTGGYSGSWGVKALKIKAGTVVAVSVGAAGSGGAANGVAATAGGNTVVTINGSSYIAYGGLAGMHATSTVQLINGPSQSSNFDFGAASVKPGYVSSGTTGGAGVDIFAQGNNATTSASMNQSGGGGTGSASSGYMGGGANGPASMNGVIAINPFDGEYFEADNREWGISFFGGGGGFGGTSATAGGNGGGGGSSSVGKNGGNGGGGGSGGTSSGNGGNGGYGGGGGASYLGGNGGSGYAYMQFFSEVE